MSGFLTPLNVRVLSVDELRIRRLPMRQHYEVLSPLIYESDLVGRIEIPKGFVTDFGSVPRWFKWIIDDNSIELSFASLPHDALYAWGGVLPQKTVTRKDADLVLREAVALAGAARWKITAIYLAVRLGGWAHWTNKKS